MNKLLLLSLIPAVNSCEVILHDESTQTNLSIFGTANIVINIEPGAQQEWTLDVKQREYKHPLTLVEAGVIDVEPPEKKPLTLVEDGIVDIKPNIRRPAEDAAKYLAVPALLSTGKALTDMADMIDTHIKAHPRIVKLSIGTQTILGGVLHQVVGFSTDNTLAHEFIVSPINLPNEDTSIHKESSADSFTEPAGNCPEEVIYKLDMGFPRIQEFREYKTDYRILRTPEYYFNFNKGHTRYVNLGQDSVTSRLFLLGKSLELFPTMI